MDSTIIQQSSNLISIGIPVGTSVFFAIVTILGVFLAAKFASDRFLENHNNSEQRLLETFKLDISKEIVAIDKTKVGWSDLEEHRKENKKSLERSHERIDGVIILINDKVEVIRDTTTEMSSMVNRLVGGFEEHKNLKHNG